MRHGLRRAFPLYHTLVPKILRFCTRFGLRVDRKDEFSYHIQLGRGKTCVANTLFSSLVSGRLIVEDLQERLSYKRASELCNKSIHNARGIQSREATPWHDKGTLKLHRTFFLGFLRGTPAS